MKTILIVDDDKRFCNTLSTAIRSHGNFEVLEAYNGTQALVLIEQRKDIACTILDWDFTRWGGPNQMNGTQIAEKIRDIAPDMVVYMMSDVAGIAPVNEAHTKHLTVRFLDKSDFGSLMTTLQTFLHQSPATHDVNISDMLSQHGFFTKSEAMKQICLDAIECAKNHTSLLLIGESGTGKKELAKLIHKARTDTSGGFHHISCSAIPEGEHYNTIIGKAQTQGIIQTLQGGISDTIYLDELSDIPFTVQASLCQILESQQEANATTAQHIIASTEQNIPDVLASGKLRRDFYYLFEQVIVMPTLRNRLEDIPELIQSYIESLSPLKQKAVHITPEAMLLLQGQQWYGNIQQLQRVIKRALHHAENNTITPTQIQRELRIEYGIDVVASSGRTINEDVARKQFVHELLRRPRDMNNYIKGGYVDIDKEFKRELFYSVLSETNGNKTQAAKILGVSRFPDDL